MYTLDDWIADLESGEYEQAQGRLCKVKDGKASYCCLGLAAERAGLLSEESIEDEDARSLYPDADIDWKVREIFADGNQNYPPFSLAEKMGLPNNNRTTPGHHRFDPMIILYPGEEDNLLPLLRASEANDKEFTFAQIAKGLREARKQGLYDA